MISKDRPKKVRIHITTYTKPVTKYYVEMNKACCKNDVNSRFICSICLNTSLKQEEQKNLECDRRKSRSCPMCQGSAVNAESREMISKNNKTEDKLADSTTKNVQTSKFNVDQGLNLLTEVLTVFQSQKENIVKEKNSRTIIMKDACVSTDVVAVLTKKPKLSVSKTFQVSIEGHDVQESGKFHVVDSCQPKVITNSQCSIDLIKHKSSSIPQMKMDELKNSLKEKSKTNKDAVDEVNRMFANVKRDGNFDNINRPLVRSGPRVLPVVKTTVDSTDYSSEQSRKQVCMCCQTKQTNYYMSSGDTLVKQERCEKSVNVECCNKNHNRIPKEIPVCERCRKPSRSFDY